MAKLWRFVAHDADRIARMGRDLNVSPVVAQLLLGRGIDDVDAARDFLDCRLSSLRDPESVEEPAYEVTHWLRAFAPLAAEPLRARFHLASAQQLRPLLIARAVPR